MKWHKKDIDSELVRSLSSRFSIDLLTASIMVRRGISDAEDILYFLEKDLLYTHNPFLFVEMDEVVDRIQAAADEGERVRIIGDRDVDGIASTVLMYDALRALGIEASWSLPIGDDPYGLTMASVDDFASADGTLLITVDCGISNFREIEYAAERGIDTIVIDHHNPGSDLPPAFAIINPKVEEGGYPFAGLAGCGVVSKVVQALRFGRTPFYNQSVCLLNVRPGNGSFTLDALKMVNLVETARLSETFVPGIVDAAGSRMADFLSGHEILVYEAGVQTRMLKNVFGADAEIGLIDLAPELWKLYPNLRGRSLLKLREVSRRSLYSEKGREEIDVLANLFSAYVYKKIPELSDTFRPILDLVALGTLADLMPLRDENRILVTQGMEILNSSARDGLRELLFVQNLAGKTLTTTDVGWQLSPLINATGRLGVPDKAVRLLLSEDSGERRILSEEIVALNRERKRLGDAAWEKLFPEAKRSFDELHEKLVFVGSREVHRGITGILAARLANTFHVPAMVVAVLEDKAVGSIRSAEGYNVKDFLEKLSDIFTDFGGHDFAAGFTLEHGSYDILVRRVRELSAGVEITQAAEPVLEIDAEIPPSFMTPELIRVVEQFEPYGEGSPPLVFMTRGVEITNIDFMGRNGRQHVRLLVDTGKHKWPAVFWNASERVNRDFSLNDTVDIVFRMGRNYYQNQENLQLTILDIAAP